jgi:hypothetical protein
VSETPDERAGRLIGIGLDIAVRIRDEDPAAVARTLDGLDRTELRDAILLLAAAVDVSVTPTVLFGWLGIGIAAGCGTQPAVSGHRRRGQPLDPACLAFDARRKRLERAT